MNTEKTPETTDEFDDNHKKGVYRAIYTRRDIRSQFRGDNISEKVLSRVLHAAHRAPSVGFMQPWNFILIKDRKIREEIYGAFKRANAEATMMFADKKKEQYKKFKLEGILESSLNICVTCDRKRFGPVVIGRTANLNMDIFSSVCAVQNLWLAARAEGLGVGWVSIIHDRDLRSILNIPQHTLPIAYLCIGYVTHFPDEPELMSAGWLPRVSLNDLVFCDKWGTECESTWHELHEAIRLNKPFHTE